MIYQVKKNKRFDVFDELIRKALECSFQDQALHLADHQKESRRHLAERNVYTLHQQGELVRVKINL
jgi:hypothetical protein